MRNNNGEIIRRLTVRSLRSNRKGNVFIVIAVMLTTLLLGSVFSIGMSLSESVKIDEIRIWGTTAQAAVGHPTALQLEKLGRLDYVSAVGTGCTAASVKSPPKMNGDILSLYYFDSTDWEKMRSPAYTGIAGSYPQKENEIMVPTRALQKAGIAHPSVGMEIPLDYYTGSGKAEKLVHKSFRLSGWFNDYTTVDLQVEGDTILVSKAFLQKCGKSVEKDGAADLTFRDPSKTQEYLTKLRQDLSLSADQPVASVNLYDVDPGEARAGVIAVVSIIVFIVAIGYLLIYNVLNLSVSRSVRFYGLLKTIGTTPKQIRRIVTGQIARLCLIGIPAGEILAVLFSVVIVPWTISRFHATSTGAVVSFSPWIYLGAALFAFLTAFLGARKPAKKAAGISPIEAQKFTEAGYNGRSGYQPTRGNPCKMVLRNIFRDRKRAMVVLLGLFLGLTTFVAVTTLVDSLGIDNYIASGFEGDFVLENHALINPSSPKQKFDGAFLEKIKALPGFQNLRTKTTEWIRPDYSQEQFGKYVANFAKKNNLPSLTQQDIQKDFIGQLVGVDRSTIMKLNQKGGRPVDADAFERGNFGLLAADDPDLLAGVREVTFQPVSRVGSKAKIQIGGFVPNGFEGIGFGLAPSVLVSNTLMEKLYRDPMISTLYIDVAPAKQQQALQTLKQLTDGDSEITRSSKLEMREKLNDVRTVLYTLGDGIALVVALIGILNFINVMSVGIMVRKHELATLESIGMSHKQMRKLLVGEGLGYAAITLLLVLTFGNLITYGIFTLLCKQVTFAVFTYPFIPVIAVCLVIIAICVITPELEYRSLCKSTIIERLREAE